MRFLCCLVPGGVFEPNVVEARSQAGFKKSAPHTRAPRRAEVAELFGELHKWK